MEYFSRLKKNSILGNLLSNLANLSKHGNLRVVLNGQLVDSATLKKMHCKCQALY